MSYLDFVGHILEENAKNNVIALYDENGKFIKIVNIKWLNFKN